MIIPASEWQGKNWRDVHPLELSDEQFVLWMQLQRADDARRSIGGSNAARIARVSKYGGPADAWDSILRLSPDKPFGDKSWQQRGIMLEPIIAEMYCKKYEKTVRPGHNDASKFGTWHHPVFDFLTAHPDFLIDDLVEAGVLECKTVFGSDLDEVKSTGAKPEHVIQTMHYMFVLNLSWGVIAYFNADRWEMYCVPIRRDEAFVRKMEERNIKFWREHVMARVRPDDLIHSPKPIVVPQTGGEAIVVATAEYRNAVKALVEAQENKKLSEHAHNMAKEAVEALMVRDGYDKISVDDHKVGRMTKAGREYFDEAELFRAYPFIDLDKFRKHSGASDPYVQCWPAKPKKGR